MEKIKKIIFYIFKPLNPVDVVNGKSVNSFTLLDRFVNIKNGNLKEILIIPKHIVLSSLSIFYLPIALILFFKKFKFLRVNFWQYGAPSQEIGTIIKYLKFSKFNTKKLIYLSPKWISQTSEANKLFKSEVIVIENFFLYLILLPFLMIEYISMKPYLADSSHINSKYNLINDVHELYKRSFETFKIKKIPKKIFKKYNLNKEKYIVLNIREDKEYSSSRSVTKINNYKKTINYYLKKKIKIIRILDECDTKIKIHHKGYVELLGNKTDLFDQVSLFKFAKFAIVSQSGPAGYACFLDTPFLLVNSIDHNTDLVPKKIDLIIYKKINPKYLKNKTKYKKFKYLDNTPNQILNAAIKIENKLKNKNKHI